MKRELVSSFIISLCIHASVLAILFTAGRHAVVAWKPLSSRPISVHLSLPIVERLVEISPVPEPPPVTKDKPPLPAPVKIVQDEKKVEPSPMEEMQAHKENTSFDPPEQKVPHHQPMPPAPEINDMDPMEEAKPLHTVNRKPPYPRVAVRNGWEGR